MPRIWEITLDEFVGGYEINDNDLKDMDMAFRDEIEWFGTRLDHETATMIRAGFELIGRGGRRGATVDVLLAGVRGSPRDVLLVTRDAYGDYDVAGGYCDASLWVSPALRGHGLSVELVLAAAERRDCDMDAVSFTSGGLAAHKAAHRLGVARALAAGFPVPEQVLADYPDLTPAEAPAPRF